MQKVQAQKTQVQNLMVEIVDDYSKSLPFGELKSRVVVATLLSYYGDTQEVYGLLQWLSHRARAFIVSS